MTTMGQESWARGRRPGADVNAHREEGTTALMTAAESNRNPEVIRILVDAGDDAALKSGEGMTAL